MPDNSEKILAKDEEGVEEPFGLGCALESFVEVTEVLQIIDNLRVIHNDVTKFEKAYERYNYILGQYVEQPHLLDLQLDNLIASLLCILRSADSDFCETLLHCTAQCLFTLVNVRGYKIMVQHLPHEVSDFEVVLRMLEKQDPQNSETWCTKYVLLLWLSIIVRIPFDLSKFDGECDSSTTVMSRILNIIKTYIVLYGKCQDAASFLSAFFMTRNDVKQRYLGEYIEWCMHIGGGDFSTVFAKEGALSSLCMLLKHGKRDDMLVYGKQVLLWLMQANFSEHPSTTIEKLFFKIVQRIGLLFLPVRVAKWRYQRGTRSLASNLGAADNGTGSSGSLNDLITTDENTDHNSNANDESGSNQTVPDEMDEVIDQLIRGLTKGDRVVRWSAAKGIGRVTSRLPRHLADEVVGFILELFNPREGDGAWHGACLALAELGRRGLLLPERLPVVTSVVVRALSYDEPKGYASVGSHIRDAACYVCWSFARAYDPEIFRPYVPEIATALLIMACFDREINCRRAASAAFQENVGRQGTFPHGIDILIYADFYAVSSRAYAYLDVSIHIAKYPEYMKPLIVHLVERKVAHWDQNIRELSARALHLLTSLAPSYMKRNVLGQLFDKTRSSDLNSRHGATLAIGAIVHALSQSMPLTTSCEEDTELLNEIEKLLPTYWSKSYFRGMGGELMRLASCEFIQKCSLAQLAFENSDITDNWLSFLNECIPQSSPTVRSAAIAALPDLLEKYYQSAKYQQILSDEIGSYVDGLLTSNVSNGQEARCGYAMALGATPPFLFAQHADRIVDALIESIAPTSITLKWAESRRDAIIALTNIIKTHVADSTTSNTNVQWRPNDRMLRSICHAFLAGLQDYTQDKRGDVGAWVREAAMTGLETLLTTTVVHNVNEMKLLLESGFVHKIMCGICQQAVEKIDRVRAHAGQIFYKLLTHTNPTIIPGIPHHTELLRIFTDNDVDFKFLKWTSANHTFPLFVQLLQFPAYRYSVMLGMVSSVGGVTESLVRSANASLFNYMDSMSTSCLEAPKSPCVSLEEAIGATVCAIFRYYQHNDRITVPILRLITKMLVSGCLKSSLNKTVVNLNDATTVSSDIDQVPKKLDANLNAAEDLSLAKTLFGLVRSELKGCRDIHKLVEGITTFAQFIQVKETQASALTQLCLYLCHRQPYVRRTTSTILYEALLLCSGDEDDVSTETEENLNHGAASKETNPSPIEFSQNYFDNVMELLSNTDWTKTIDDIKPVRNKICELLHLSVPVAIVRTK